MLRYADCLKMFAFLMVFYHFFQLFIWPITTIAETYKIFSERLKYFKVDHI